MKYLPKITYIMAKKHYRAIYSYMVVVMAHIIKWNSQPDKKSKSWEKSIQNGQITIEDIKENNPGISDATIKDKWDKAFSEATEKAEKEMAQKSTVDNLTWEQVFQTKYVLTALAIIGLIIAGCLI